MQQLLSGAGPGTPTRKENFLLQLSGADDPEDCLQLARRKDGGDPQRGPLKRRDGFRHMRLVWSIK